MNSIVLLGRATSSIELKQTQAGKSVVNFSLAVKRPFAKDTTDFYTVIAWDKQAETLSRYVGKGDQICIRGYLQNRSWEDKDGNKRVSCEVVAQEISFCGAKASPEGNNTAPTSNGSQSENSGTYGYNPYANATPDFEKVDTDDDLPF